ncbi:YfiR family protein [Ideonella sp. YS5]|uniref:YfiR family protein n=1 Tax=Ideonella sp. YS5 TaxID=3453714 RepID=UPI003EF010E7
MDQPPLHVLTTRSRPAASAQAWQALRWAALFALMLSSSMQRSWGAEDAEYRIKAAFLCKFGNYVDWPDTAWTTADASFVIGVLGHAPVVDAVAAAAAGQAVNGRPITVRRVERMEAAQGLNILFVARTHAGRLAEALAALKDQPVLVVTEQDAATPGGSMVNFVVVDDKVKFDVWPAAAERNHLRVSARLLGVARQVNGGAP